MNVNGQSRYASRNVYEAHRGPVPEGKELDHLCRNHSCVNPWHLEPVTHRENILRGLNSRLAPPRPLLTHCKRGHELLPGNVYKSALRNGKEQRRCKACYQSRREENALAITVRGCSEVAV